MKFSLMVCWWGFCVVFLFGFLFVCWFVGFFFLIWIKIFKTYLCLFFKYIPLNLYSYFKQLFLRYWRLSIFSLLENEFPFGKFLAGLAVISKFWHYGEHQKTLQKKAVWRIRTMPRRRLAAPLPVHWCVGSLFCVEINSYYCIWRLICLISPSLSKILFPF